MRAYVRRFRQDKRIGDNSELSFYASPDANRTAFLNGLLEVDFAARAVVVDKRTLSGDLRLKGLDFYVHFWTVLFKWLAFDELNKARVVLHEYGGPATTIPALARSLRSELGLHIPGPQIAKPIRAARSSAEIAIEAADMVAGSILRMAEIGDARFYRLIRSRAEIWRPIENQNPPS